MDCYSFAFIISSWNCFIGGQALCNEHIQVSFMETSDCFCSLDIILTKFLRKGCTDSPSKQCNSSDVSSALELQQPHAALQAG